MCYATLAYMYNNKIFNYILYYIYNNKICIIYSVVNHNT